MVGGRLDYQMTRQAVDALPLHAQRNRPHDAAKVIAAVDQKALATLQDGAGLAQLRAALEPHHADARVDQPHLRQPDRDERPQPARLRHQLRHTNPLAAGLPTIDGARLLRGTRSATRSSRSPRASTRCCQVANDVTWIAGRHSIKVGIDVRRDPMDIAFINRPNGNFTFNGGLTGNAAADFLLGLPSQARATTQQVTQDGYGWLFAVYVQDDFRLTQNLTVNVGVRYELPCRSSTRTTPSAASARASSPRSTRTRPAASCTPAMPACRAASYRPTRTTSRRACRWRGIRSATARTSVRAAFGVFYDALAGQGDFFQSGVLSPPFTPLVELNTPTPITLSDPLAAVAGRPTRSRPRSPSSAGATTSSRRRRTTSTSACSASWPAASAPKWPTSGRAASTCRCSSRSTRASSRRDRPRAGPGCCRPTRSCGRPSRWRSRGSTRCRRACGCCRGRA